MSEKSGTNGKKSSGENYRGLRCCSSRYPEKNFKKRGTPAEKVSGGRGADTWSTYCPSNKAYVVYLSLVSDFSDTALCNVAKRIGTHLDRTNGKLQAWCGSKQVLFNHS
jgi:hypothetical protein